MPISNDQVVTFHYTLTDEGGSQLENSYEAEPVQYLHGHKNMLPGLEEALAGKESGENVSVTLPPEKAYGLRKEGETQRIAKKHILTKGKLTPGMIVQVKTEHGPQEAILVKAGLKTVDLDSNHPYAGKTLTFAMAVVDLREATAEEISHGHVHGAGGCGH
ncbi:MAG: peptidylprolyl isomerase [Cellvibrionaceae bacterium]